MGTQCYFTSWTVFLLLLYFKKKMGGNFYRGIRKYDFSD